MPGTPTSSPPPHFPETPTAADSRASAARRIAGTPHRGSISGTALSPPPPPPLECTVETPVARGRGGTNLAADGSMPAASTSISPTAALTAEERPMTAEAERRARLLMQKVEALTTKLEQSRSRQGVK